MSDLPVPSDPPAAPLLPVVSPEPPAPQTLVCANCGAALAGEYCAACGQRHEPHVHTVTHFAGEAFESISHADSRLWRTLLYLLGKPGHLTREFFDGRRVRYLPPFRLYLVISVLFFLVVGLGGDEPGIEIEKPKTAEDIAAINQVADALQNRKMGDDGATGAKLADQLRAIAQRQAAEIAARPAPTGGAAPADKRADDAAGDADDDSIRIATGEDVEGGISQFCAEFDTDDARDSKPDANRDSVRRWCKRFDERGVGAIGEALAHNIPRAMFVFLPLLALCMRLMYWRPKRYYVEHLLFMVHNHAFVFLAATIVLLIGMIPFVGDYAWPLYWATFFYMAWYIYRAMRNVYGQGRGLTVLKYLTLGYLYVIAGFSIFVATLAYSAITF
jgi:hypothetical protein